MRVLALCVLAACGCKVEIGAGSIAPVEVDQPIDPTAASPPVSLAMEAEFLSMDQAAQLADQYGKKLGAIDAIDVQVQALGIVDAAGEPVAGSALVLAFEGVTIDRVGQRVRLPKETKRRAVAAVTQRMALTLHVQITVSWPETAPAEMEAHAVLQPIVVVDALSAL